MNLLEGLNHAAVVTDDLDRFIEFYAGVFEMDVLFRETTPRSLPAVLRPGARSWLHPAALVGNPHASALPDMFARGHIDHLALGAPSREAFEVIRQRLVERSASTGLIEDLGAMHALWFQDPDGMRGEVCLIVDPELRRFHAPRPLVAGPST
jgi:catechol 2,3-dioxygenase-like lactoylglutathione lyase family enzyme